MSNIATDLNLLDQSHIGGFEHGVGGLDLGDKTFGFNHSDCF